MANTSFDSQPGQDDNVNLANNIWRLIGAQEGENDPGNQRSGWQPGSERELCDRSRGSRKLEETALETEEHCQSWLGVAKAGTGDKELFSGQPHWSGMIFLPSFSPF